MLMVKKTVKFTKDAIEKLPKDKPVVYKIGEPTNPEYIGETEKNPAMPKPSGRARWSTTWRSRTRYLEGDTLRICWFHSRIDAWITVTSY